MTTTTEARTERCDVCGWRQENHPRGEWCDAHQPRAIGTTEASTVYSWTWTRPARVFGVDAARIMLPFVERAEALPADAERILRDGMDYTAEFAAGAPLADEPALIRAAGRYLDRNYPVGVAA